MGIKFQRKRLPFFGSCSCCSVELLWHCTSIYMHTSFRWFFLGPFLHLRQKSVSGSGIAVKSSSMNSATSLRMQTTILIRPALRIRNVRQAIVAVAEYLHNLAIEFYAQKQSVQHLLSSSYINAHQARERGLGSAGIEELHPFRFSYINYIIFAAFGRGQELPNSSIGIIIVPMMKIILAGTWTIIACNIIKAIKALKLPENPGHMPMAVPIGSRTKLGGYIQR